MGPVSYKLRTTGDVLPLMQVDLIFRVSGYLERVSVQIGDRVRAGQLLASIERTQLLQRVNEIEGRVAGIRAKLAELRAGARPEEIAQAEEAFKQTESRFENAKKNKERLADLFKRNLVARKDLDDAELAYELALAQRGGAENQLRMVREGARTEVRQATEAQLQEAEALLAQQRSQLKDAQLVAPFDGFVTRRLADPGALVTSSTPVLTVVHTGTVKVLANILEKDISLVRAGASALVKVDAFPEKEFLGSVARLNSALDSNSRTLQAEIRIANPSQTLKPGMFATIQLKLIERPQVMLIPTDAVLEDEKGSYVYVVREGKSERKPIRLGLKDETRVEVAEGVKIGDQVVVAGYERLRPGTTVRVLRGDRS
jgi:cobalt-zinc-cadmium efflux system membrane fusion protein